MRTFLMLVALLGVNQLSAQKLKDAEVPAAAKKTFEKSYPDIKGAKWEKEDGNYEAEFELNKKETSVLFDVNGNLLATETEISPEELPKAVSEYVAKNLKGQKIDEASKIIDSKGGHSFEAEIGGADYIFDSNGTFIKKE